MVLPPALSSLYPGYKNLSIPIPWRTIWLLKKLNFGDGQRVYTPESMNPKYGSIKATEWSGKVGYRASLL